MKFFPPVIRDLKPSARWSVSERKVFLDFSHDSFLTMTPAEAERVITELNKALNDYAADVEAAA